MLFVWFLKGRLGGALLGFYWVCCDFFHLGIFCGGLALLRVENNLLDCFSACPNFILSVLDGRRDLPEDLRLKSIGLKGGSYGCVFRNMT